MAELAVSKIVLDRQKELVRQKETDATARYKPRRVCHIIDSIKNQEELDILKLVYRDMLYFVGVYAPLSARVRALEDRGMNQGQIYQLVDQDSGEEFVHGQTVRDTFPQADFFLRVNSNTDSHIAKRVDRFLHLILGTRILTPTYAETAMYQAASAAGNSACLSRQVGAAITSADGEILAVGWNDVPKAKGGLYSANPDIDPNSDFDRRCWNLRGGMCFNDQEKETISELLVDSLISQGLIKEDKRSGAIDSVMGNSKVRDLIEFSRSIHAEMHAIITAAQIGTLGLKGAKLYSTTYPCHSCARHIVAAGITEVYYIEPYRKSLAIKLHNDSITEDERDESKVRILPFDGVAPARYLKLFRVQQDSRKRNGKLISRDPKTAGPRFDKTLEALPTLEALVVEGLRKKQLVDVEATHAQTEN